MYKKINQVNNLIILTKINNFILGVVMGKTFSYSTFNKYSYMFLTDALNQVNPINKTPVVICVGTDLVVGDSLGPLIGTMIKKSGVDAFVYGTLNNLVTAKDIPRLNERIRKTHPKSPILVVDAAVGEDSDVGMIRVIDNGIKPGLGVNKDLEKIGDYSVIGVVAKKDGGKALSRTRLNLIYLMAGQISEGILNHIKKQKSQ